MGNKSLFITPFGFTFQGQNCIIDSNYRFGVSIVVPTRQNRPNGEGITTRKAADRMRIANEKYKRGRAQSGASLPLALLLMLICALLTSVVLAASTGVAGRFKNLTEMDAHYYSATSAAGLLAKEIEGSDGHRQKAILKCTKKTTESSTAYTLQLLRENGGTLDPVISIPGGTTLSTIFGREGGLTLTEIAALSYVCGGETAPASLETVWNWLSGYYGAPSPSSPTKIAEYEYTLSGNATGVPSGFNLSEATTVSVKQTVMSDGDFDLDVMSGNATGNNYLLTLICAADVDIEQQVQTSQDEEAWLVSMSWNMTEISRAGR